MLQELLSSPVRFLPVLVIVGIGMYFFLKSRQQGSTSSHGALISLFTRDITADAGKGSMDPVIGRVDEIERVIHILSRRTKNNPLLIGPPGVGKTAIVEGLAYKIAQGDVPNMLRGKRVLSLKVSALLAGTKYRGELEERAQKLVQELEQAKRDIILFVDEIQTLVQSKGTEGAVNLSDIFKPALARGDLSLIGATSLKEYDQYIVTDETLERRFQPVVVDEPTVTEAIEILEGLKIKYEEFHGVEITHDAVVSAVKLSHEYIRNRQLPDKAIDLIDEAGAMVKVDVERGTSPALGIIHAAAKSSKGNGKGRPVVTEAHIREIVEDWTGESLSGKKKR